MGGIESTEERLKTIRAKSTEDMTPEEIALLPDRDKAIRGLIYDSVIYDSDWFELQEWQHPWCQKLMGWLGGEYGPFDSSLDLGAGDGYYSHVLAEMGTTATAVEVSEEALPAMSELVNNVVHDLREPLDLGQGFDLVLSLEVAEHLPLSAADIFCDTIARHCTDLLVFTAAAPGQGGHGHCNLQPFDFWRDRLQSRGLRFLASGTDRIRQAWKNILRDSVPWLSKNVTLFERQR